MSYEAFEESEDQGLPVSLFLIEYGDTATNFFAYTDSDVAVTHEGIDYKPVPIGREKMEASGGLDNKTLEIDISPKTELIEFYKTREPSQVVSLKIMQGHVGDTTNDFVTVWMGRIISVEHKTRYDRINAEPIATSMRRPGLRRQYQYGCPWALYSVECGASQAAARVTAAVQLVGKNVIEFNSGWEGSFGKQKFSGGFLRWSDATNNSTQVRTILQVGEAQGGMGRDLLILNGNVQGLEESQVLELFLGCNHQMSDCRNLHNNIVNFGGQPWIPTENPVGFVNRFY